jgi:hypothetical protein
VLVCVLHGFTTHEFKSSICTLTNTQPLLAMDSSRQVPHGFRHPGRPLLPDPLTCPHHVKEYYLFLTFASRLYPKEHSGQKKSNKASILRWGTPPYYLCCPPLSLQRFLQGIAFKLNMNRRPPSMTATPYPVPFPPHQDRNISFIYLASMFIRH